jgi:nucleoid-associated protein YgaU
MYASSMDFMQLQSRRPRLRPPGLAPRMARRLAVLAAALVMLLGVGFAHGVQGTAPVEYDTVTVQPGDTLWSLAERRYPGEDVRTRVAEIERANGLGDPVLHGGQTLRLPASQAGQKPQVGAG